MSDAPSSSAPPAPTRPTTRAVVPAVVLDVVAVLAFAVGGRSTHAADTPVVYTLQIAWPFLLGLAAAWLTLRAWRRPLAVWPTGVVVWVVTWVVGMAVRALVGEGLATAFLVVSAAFLLATLVGWRALALAVTSLAGRRAPR